MAEIRKCRDIPDEVKNQIIDGKKRVMTVPIPVRYLTKIKEAEQQKQPIFNQFFITALKKKKLDKQLNQLETEITKLDRVKGEETEKAFKKLKLHKQADRQWSIRGTDFVGIYNRKPKQQPPKK